MILIVNLRTIDVTLYYMDVVSSRREVEYVMYPNILGTYAEVA